MTVMLKRFVALCLTVATALAAAKKSPEETVFIFENRRVSIEVPPGLGFASTKDERGFITVRVADRKEKVNVQLTFLPDPEDEFANARVRKEFIHENFQEYLAGSTEKIMGFEELDPRQGAGTYCVFTDAALAGKEKPPPGEYLNSTTGVKAWPGVVAVFTILSNGTKTNEYAAVMAMLRESVQEKPTPLR